jgi:hypothetical protein
MKRINISVLLCFLLCAFSFQRAKAQDQDIQQLLLDIEKLTQFKAILSDMQQGYAMLTNGYETVKNLSKGNFNLHSVFLDGLLQINPEVAKYGRVADILANEASIVSEYKKAYGAFRASRHFSVEELDYLGRVYGQLTSEALNDVNELADILTTSKLRMSDDERLSAIDRIYASGNNKLVFLRSFNRQANGLLVQRQKEQNDVNNFKSLYP